MSKPFDPETAENFEDVSTALCCLVILNHGEHVANFFSQMEKQFAVKGTRPVHFFDKNHR